MSGLRLPAPLAVLVTDEPLFDVFAYGPWVWPDDLTSVLEERLRALAEDERAQALPLASPVGTLPAGTPAVIAELNVLVEFLIGEGAIYAGIAADAIDQIFDRFRSEQPTRKPRGPLEWTALASSWRPPGAGFLRAAAGDDPERRVRAYDLITEGLEVFAGVEPWERRRMALADLMRRPGLRELYAVDSHDLEGDWAEIADQEVLDVLPELAGPIGYLSWALDGWTAVNRHLRQAAAGGAEEAVALARLLLAQGHTRVPVEIAAASTIELYLATRELFDEWYDDWDDSSTSQWYDAVLDWLVRCLVVGEAESCRHWLDLSMRLSYIFAGLPGKPAKQPEPHLPVAGFQRELRRLFRVRRVAHPGVVRQRAEREQDASASGVVEGLETADRIVGQPELVRSLKRIAGAPDEPVRLLIAGPPSTGKTLAVRVLEQILGSRSFVQEPAWMSPAGLQSASPNEAREFVRSLVESSVDRRLLVLECLDDLLRDPSHGAAVAEELRRGLETYGARLPVAAFTAVGGDQKVKAAMEDAEVEWQVAHTRDFGLEDYLVLFRAAAERRGAEVDDETLRTAASLLAASTSTDLRNARLVDHLADRAVANARRREPDVERVELRPSDLPRQIVADATGEAGGDEDQERDALAELEALPGLAGVKRVVSTIVAEARAQELRRQAGQRVRSPSRHLIFVGNAGTGKTMVARRLGSVFRQLGLLSRGHVVEVTRTDLVGEFRSETAPKVTAVFERALGGVLFIDEAYTLAPKARGDMGQDATDTLMKLMEDYRDDVVVIAAGYEAPMREFLTANPGLESRFATIVHFPDLTDDELVQVFRSRAAAEGVALGPGVEERVRELLRRTSRGPTFGNARVMRSLLDRAMSAQAHRVLSEERPDPQQLRTLLVEDLPTSLTNRTRTEGGPEPLAELDRMVGLESIKAEVHALVAEAKAEELRRTAGVPIASPTRHLVFTGSPGTAKTTVARLLAAIYADLGLLSSGHLVEVGRSDLVGEYVGQTAPKVTAVVERALGGVLFIDEAYALAGRRGRDEYGAEAIATLLKLMEDNRSDLVVIVAGYEQEMTEFLASNPGLASRFPRIIRFPDYSNDELVAIFAAMLESAGLVAGEGLLDRVRQVITEAPRDRSFGNARFVRNLLDRAIAAQAQRLTAGEGRPSVEEIRTLRSEDLAGALEGDEGIEIPIGQYL